MNYFNALMDPGQIGQGVGNAFRQGWEDRRQSEAMNALAAYAKNRNQDTAAAVTAHDPMMGIQLQDREDQRAAAEYKRQVEAYQMGLQKRAATGDQQALAELAGIDLQAWNTISDQERGEVKERVNYIGQAALAISQLPEQQRAAAWDAYAIQGAQRWPELQQVVGRYSPEALQAALAQAGQINEFLTRSDPRYQVIPEGGVMVNTRDPQAVQQFQSGQNAPPQAAVDYLLGHPELWREFDQKYGQGAAQRILGVR